MAYGGFKYLPRRVAADKVLRDIAKNPLYDAYQRGLGSCFNALQIFWLKNLMVLIFLVVL